MMGLLGGLEDPKQMGMLSLGLRLMSTPGKFGQALGQAGMGALGDMQQAVAQQRENEERKKRQDFLDWQISQQKSAAARQEAIDALPAQFMRPAMRPPTMDDRDVGMPGEASVRPTMDLAGLSSAMMATPGGLEMGLRLQSMLEPKKPENLFGKINPADFTPESVTRFVQTGSYADLKPLPKEQGGDIAKYNLAVTQGYKGTITDWIRENNKAGASSNTQIVGTGQAREVESGYRKEFNALPQVTRYNAALPAYKAVVGAASRMGTQSEINMIYGLAKLYDPESVVREGEYDTIANSQSIPEWIKSAAQRLAGNGKLTPETRRQIVQEANARIGALREQYDAARSTYTDVVKRQGLDPKNVFIDVGAALKPNEGKPARRTFNINGQTMTAELGDDGMYYVKRNGKTYRVEE